MREIIPIIDLFAGPGGLGEGFSSFSAPGRRRRSFKILLSVEKDPYAHQTLELRSFFRKFLSLPVPDDYYRYLRREITREELFAARPRQAAAARREALQAELGNPDHDRVICTRIEEELGAATAREWVLIGGPPCQAYSVIGRSRMRSADPQKFEKDARHFLYREYLQIIARFRPAVFVMENVKGILSSQINDTSIFDQILSDLKAPGLALNPEATTGVDAGDPGQTDLRYRIYSLVAAAEDPENLSPDQFVIASEHYGVPQTRHRVILLGVRSDLNAVPGMLARRPLIPVRKAIEGLPRLRSCLSQGKDGADAWLGVIRSCGQAEWFRELFPMDRIDLLAAALRDKIDRAVEAVEALETGKEFKPGAFCPEYHTDWFHDARIGGVCNHTARAHMGEDLHRYLYAACYAQVYGVAPQMQHFPPLLRPNHSNVQEGSDLETFDDRFRVQVAGRPATTITAHIAKDGHYNIHYDPRQCRSLTVREAARIQTFPDNYFFEGSRTQQYRQVGNAVPPFLAYQIAGIVNGIMEAIDAGGRPGPGPLPPDPA